MDNAAPKRQSAINNPAFWQHVGNPLATALVLYPWALLAVAVPLLLVTHSRLDAWYPAPVRALDAEGRFILGWPLAIGWTVAEAMFWAGCVAFPLALAWWIFSWFGTRLGVTESWGWYVRTLIGFGGAWVVWEIVKRVAIP